MSLTEESSPFKEQIKDSIQEGKEKLIQVIKNDLSPKPIRSSAGFLDFIRLSDDPLSDSSSKKDDDLDSVPDKKSSNELGKSSITELSSLKKFTMNNEFSNLFKEIENLDFELSTDQELENLLFRIESTSANLIQQQKKKLLDKMKKPQNVEFVDRIAFTLGVLTSHLTLYLVSVYPHLFPSYYTFLVIPLMILRFIMYKNANAHFFMLDYCYFVQALCLSFIHLFSTSRTVFLIAFTATNGPLVCAILAWKNSLVFHDLDKITSLFIHVLPGLITYSVRWKNREEFPKIFEELNNISANTWFNEAFLGSLCFYLFWQICYYIMTEVIFKKIIEKNPKNTSFRYLNSSKTTFVGILLAYFPANYKLFGFFIIQFVYSIGTFLPTYFCLINLNFHKIYLFFFFTVSIWNGAQFYIQKFSKDYHKKIRKLERLGDADDFWKNKSQRMSSYQKKKDHLAERLEKKGRGGLTKSFYQ